MIDLSELPAPIEEMFFYPARRDDGKIHVVGAYNDPVGAGVGLLTLGSYPDTRAAATALDEITRLQALTKALLK